MRAERRRVGVLIRWVNVSEVVDGMKTKGYLGDPETLWLFSSISMVRMRVRCLIRIRVA